MSLNIHPSLVVSYQSNLTGRHVRNNGKCVRGYSLAKQFSDVYNLFRSKFMSGLLFASQVNQPSFPSVLGIMSQRNPFQVFWAVVGLYTVNMVNSKTFSVAMYKHHANQPMHQLLGSDAVVLRSNFKVSVFANTLSKFAALGFRCKGLSFPVSSSGVSCFFGWRRNRPILTNKPRNAFGNNGVCFHSVGILA